MKNVPHPNMFPVAASAPADGNEVAVVTDADVSGIEHTPGAPSASSPFAAHPTLAKFRTASAEEVHEPEAADANAKAVPAAAPKRQTVAQRVIAYLAEKGPSKTAEICAAVGIDRGNGAGVQPFIGSALKSGEIVQVMRGMYALPGQKISVPPAPSPAPTQPTAPKAQSAGDIKVPARAESAAAAEVPTRASKPAVGRKPEFVLFVGALQLLAWPDGGITMQSENASIELDKTQARALLVLAELRT